jgi:hypothetical protein
VAASRSRAELIIGGCAFDPRERMGDIPFEVGSNTNRSGISRSPARRRRRNPIPKSAPLMLTTVVPATAGTYSGVVDHKFGALITKGCHSEEPTGRQSNLGAFSLCQSTRLRRFARNDGPIYVTNFGAGTLVDCND